MNAITSLSNTTFSFNGIPYLKNYLSRVAGNRVTIFNAYENRDVLCEFAEYTEFTVNGDTFPSASALQEALLTVTYARTTLGMIDNPFRGTIVPSSPAPSQYGMYQPKESGTYTNFGGIVVDLTEGVTYIVYTESGFSKTVYPLSVEGLATQDEVDALNDVVDSITEDLNTYTPLTNPSFTNGYFASTGGQTTTAGWLRTSGTAGAGMYAVIADTAYYYTGVIDASAPNAVGVAFYNSGGTRIGTAIASAATYTHEPLTLPVGTVYIGACSFGTTGPQIGTIVTSKKIPLDSINANLATLEDLAPVQLDVEELNTFKDGAETVIEVDRYYTFNNAEVNFTSDFTVSVTGDYVEWVGKNNNAPGPTNDDRSLYLFGKKTTNNTIGYYTNPSGQECIRVRASDSTNIEMGIGSGIVWQDWHKIKVQLSGTNWLLYVDDVLIDTKAAISTVFLMSNIANAYSSTNYAEVSLRSLAVKAQGVTKTYTNFETSPDFTSSAVVAVVNGSVKEPSQCYYTVSLTGSATGNELVTVYTKIKDNVYQKALIAHMVNNTATTDGAGVRPYTNIWRLYGIRESMLENGAFSDTGRVLLFTSENELAFFQSGDPDHSGGWHGYEVLIRKKLMADGKEITLTNTAAPVACGAFEYMQYSQIYDYGANTTIAAYHSKHTDLSEPGYRVTNVLYPQIAISGIFYAGLCCTGVGIANRAWVDDLNDYTALMNGSTTTLKTGGEPTMWYNRTDAKYTATARGIFKSVVLGGVESANSWNNVAVTQVYDRTTDMKYYRKNPSGTVAANDLVINEFELKIELK